MSKTKIRPNIEKCLKCQWFEKIDGDNFHCSVPNLGEKVKYRQNSIVTIEKFKADFDMRSNYPERDQILKEYFKDKPKLRGINKCKECWFFEQNDKLGFRCSFKWYAKNQIKGASVSFALDTAHFVSKAEWFEKLEIPHL